jgi:hypothetical protein
MIKMRINEHTARITLAIVIVLLSLNVPVPCFTFNNILPNRKAQMKKTIVDIVIYTIFDLILNIDESFASAA